MSCWRRLARGRESFADRPDSEEEEAPMAAEPQPCAPGRHFRRVRPAWAALVAASLGYYSWAVFSPATIPYGYLGPLGTFTSYLVENHKTFLNIGYVITWLIHIVETLYALRLCRDKGISDGRTQIRWAIQTFLFGICSLIHLLNYDPLEETKHE
ncbi:transmembrane protein 254-like isoform X1 [Paroedura picta]|uniref:transmembrane protein 254-like isoform X1 n=1 Tax=Paroedura picta TaxID=143630 RepID=UPI00405720EF